MCVCRPGGYGGRPGSLQAHELPDDHWDVDRDLQSRVVTEAVPFFLNKDVPDFRRAGAKWGLELKCAGFVSSPPLSCYIFEQNSI